VLPNGEAQVLVSWEGWSSEYNSWVYKNTVISVDEFMGGKQGEKCNYGETMNGNKKTQLNRKEGRKRKK
jgi:hypothetical protein